MMAVMAVTLMDACAYKKADELYPSVSCPADTISTISFSRNINPVLTRNCATAGCHSGAAPEGGLDLDSAQAYAQLSKSGSGYIDTISPGNGLLYASLVSATDPMPPTGKLDDCTLKLILKWLQQKAPDN